MTPNVRQSLNRSLESRILVCMWCFLRDCINKMNLVVQYSVCSFFCFDLYLWRLAAFMTSEGWDWCFPKNMWLAWPKSHRSACLVWLSACECPPDISPEHRSVCPAICTLVGITLSMMAFCICVKLLLNDFLQTLVVYASSHDFRRLKPYPK